MAFGVKCKNCGDCEAYHYSKDCDCDQWEAERELTEDERQELIDDGERPTH